MSRYEIRLGNQREQLTVPNFPFADIRPTDILNSLNFAINIYSDENYQYIQVPEGVPDPNADPGQRRTPTDEELARRFNLDTETLDENGLSHRDRVVANLEAMAQRIRAGETPLQDLVSIRANDTSRPRVNYFIASLFLFGAPLGSEVFILEEKNALEKLINRDE